jgi:hypothetical protein
MVFGKGAIGLAVIDARVWKSRGVAIRDHGLGVMQLAIRAPHLAQFTDHGRHGSVDNGVASTCRLVMPRSEFTMASAGRAL